MASTETQMDRIERKLDALIQALIDEEEAEAPARSLDGEPVPPDRNGQALL